ncbi:MAG: hypothetical protein GC154_10565 [bacterium]|nr:hypothetical protein [bacterium]
MKKLALAALGLFVAAGAWAQPVSVSEAGVTPMTDTLIVTDSAIGNGGSLESLAISVLSNGNIALGWEDDKNADVPAGVGLAAAWLLYDQSGTRLTDTVRGHYRNDGTLIGLGGNWAPKINANQFGGGFAYGSTFWDWDGTAEDPSNAAPELPLGTDQDNPAVTTFNNDGSVRHSIFVTYPIDYLTLPGTARMGEPFYLSDGNVCSIAQNGQNTDAVDLFGFASDHKTIIAGVSKDGGEVVAGPVAVQQEDADANIWKGAAPFNGGFAVRYEAGGKVYLRMMNNDLTPMGDSIAMETAAPQLNAGGRGGSTGVDANTNGDVLIAQPSKGTADAPSADNNVFAAVWSKDGSMKLAPKLVSAPQDETLGTGANSADCAIDEAGNFVVVYENKDIVDFTGGSAVCARFFNADGSPATPSFIISGITANDVVADDADPVVDMRNGIVAVLWRDKNFSQSSAGKGEVALRVFASPFGSSSASDWALYN